MPQKSWDEMSVDQKLAWLREAVTRLIGITDKNAAAIDQRERSFSARLSAVEAAIRSVRGA